MTQKYLVQMPSWFYWASLETHIVETPGAKSTPRILEYFKLGDIPLAPNDATAWCAIFANAAFEANGFPGTKNAMARGFERSENFRKLDGPTRGALVTFYRDGKKSGFGHTGFYVGENESGTHILVLGGNQSDKVSLAWFSRGGGENWGLSGYYWPASLPDPVIGRRIMRGSPGATNGGVT